MTDLEDWDTAEDRQAIAAERLATVRQHFISGAIADWMGMPDQQQEAGNRAWALLDSLPARDIALIVAVAIWPEVEKEATVLLQKLRDFHYVDRDHGFLPVPPGRHRAEAS